MGLVTDVEWFCPKCETRNIAQLYDDWYYEIKGNSEDFTPVSRKEIPFAAASLKWNPPCITCGKYQLSEPKDLVELPIVRCNFKD